MVRSTKRRGRDHSQLKIDWTAKPAGTDSPGTSELKIPAAPEAHTSTAHASPLIQKLPWDFRTRFPQPTDEAIEAGIIANEDCHPDQIRSLHEAHARQALATLRAMDIVLDARRRRVDPTTGKPPRNHAVRERLKKYFAEEPGRLERSFTAMLGVYEDVFGADAADAFTKAIRAWHAGIAVVDEHDEPPVASSPSEAKRTRLSSALPVPRPLLAAVRSGTFGQDEHGPIRPGPDEVRAITAQHADRMVEMGDAELQSATAKYAEDFGDRPASQLERYVRRKQQERGR